MQESASGTGSPGSGSHGPGNLGLGAGRILKSGTRTGTQIQSLRNLEMGPELKFEKSVTRDWDREAKSENPGFGTGTPN